MYLPYRMSRYVLAMGQGAAAGILLIAGVAALLAAALGGDGRRRAKSAVKVGPVSIPVPASTSSRTLTVATAALMLVLSYLVWQQPNGRGAMADEPSADPHTGIELAPSTVPASQSPYTSISPTGTSTVIIPGGGGKTDAYAGPSTRGYVVERSLSAHTPVTVICTVYAQPRHFGTTTDALWDYTDHGWLNDHFVHTGVAGPTANGCLGSTNNPKLGGARPTKAAGPYAVTTAEGDPLPVRAQPAVSAPTIEDLTAGTFVSLQCTSINGPVIPAPHGLGPAHSNNVWDRIVDPDGWVPDSYVSTYSLHPVAPRCQ